MLEQATVATRLPVQDISRARAYYAEKLGLEPVDEQRGALPYRCGGSEFALFTSAGMASGSRRFARGSTGAGTAGKQTRVRSCARRSTSGARLGRGRVLWTCLAAASVFTIYAAIGICGILEIEHAA
jgi:hypothetical protein